MTNAFDTADYYTPDEGGERLEHVLVRDALEECIADGMAFPITLYAYDRKTIGEVDIDALVERTLTRLEEYIEDEFGDPNGESDIIDDATADALKAAMMAVLRNAKLCAWQCDRCGKRTFTEMPP